jgi:hypothetical protein
MQSQSAAPVKEFLSFFIKERQSKTIHPPNLLMQRNQRRDLFFFSLGSFPFLSFPILIGMRFQLGTFK